MARLTNIKLYGRGQAVGTSELNDVGCWPVLALSNWYLPRFSTVLLDLSTHNYWAVGVMTRALSLGKIPKLSIPVRPPESVCEGLLQDPQAISTKRSKHRGAILW